MGDEELIKAIRCFQASLDKHTERRNDAKLIYYLSKLCKLPIKVAHLENTGVGRTVNGLRKLEGDVGEYAKNVVGKWKAMVVGEQQTSDDDDDDDEDGYQTGGDSSDNTKVETSQKFTKDKRKVVPSSEDDLPRKKYQKDSDIEDRSGKQKDRRHNCDSDDGASRTKSSTSSKDKRHRSDSDGESSKRKSSSASSSKEKRYHSDSDNESSSKRKVSSTKSKRSHSDSDDEKSKRKSSSSKDRRLDSDSDDDTRKRNKLQNKHRSDSANNSSSKHKSSSKDKRINNSEHESSSKRKSSTKEKHHKNSDEESSSRRKEKQRHCDSDNDKKRKALKEKKQHHHHHHNSSDEDSKRKSSKEKKTYHSESDEDSKRKSSKDKHKKKEETPRKHEKKSEKEKNRDSTKKEKASSSSKTKKPNGTIPSGPSFEEALGMCMPSSSTARSSKRKTEKEKKSTDEVPKPLKDLNLDPLDINISSLLPPITPNYRPLGILTIDQLAKKPLSEYETLSNAITTKTQRTKVYSGNKVGGGKVASLFELCCRVLQDHIDALEYTGGVPYLVLKPILEKSNATQLYMMEHHNPYLVEDTDELWQLHCQKDFRNKRREELETWREMYLRCLDEREARLKTLTANIKQAQDKSIPVRMTKLAYVDAVAKPPRNIARRQAKNGTSVNDRKTTAAKLVTLATSGEAGKVAVPSPVSTSSRASSNSHAAKQKKAPLMLKSISSFKNRFKR